jgi:ABC-2 type transport system ATP-binding protein
LVKRFDTVCALDGVDLVVEEGEIRGLLGPNGAGKTTLLRLLFGLVAPDAGSIELLGRPVRASDPVVLEGVAGFVEDPTFYPYMSGRVNLELLAELDGGEAAGIIDEVLEKVGLTSRSGDRVSGYSSGMRQRLGIAAALLRAPMLLLMDEPTAGLDPAGARDVTALVRELASEGVSVLLSSHQIGEIEQVCDAFTVIRRGRVVWEGTVEQLRAQAPPADYRMMTSDDVRALAIAEGQPGVRATLGANGELRIALGEEKLDPFVLSLGAAGVAVRRLEQVTSPLEAMFFALTDDTAVDESTERLPR